jgi:hypothetical protein
MLVRNVSHSSICIDSRNEFWCRVSWLCVYVESAQFVFENDYNK